jgi:hypothetical protein
MSKSEVNSDPISETDSPENQRKRRGRGREENL